MINKTEMRSHLEIMERAASEVLQQDAAFFEALQALKSEIERDPRVKSAVSGLQDAGRRVFTSFVPYIKVRVRTKEGVFALPRRTESPANPSLDAVSGLTRELKNAASAVISSSRIRQQLDSIVNEAISNSATFEGIASQIESHGHEVLIYLDLSTYAQVHESTNPGPRSEQTNRRHAGEQAPHTALSAYDLKFMKSLKIKPDF